MITNKDNFCVIMGGGIGSRFWPFSRKTLPKQFLDFFGTGRSLLQQTFDRFKQVIPTENILVVTNDLYADLVKEQLPELNNKDKREIQEILDDTEQQLLSQDGLMFDGSPATDEDVQKIIMAMKMGMEMIKKENKAKFTPRKYRKGN